MAKRSSSRMGRLLTHLPGRRPTEPPAEPQTLWQEHAHELAMARSRAEDEFATARSRAEDALARADHAIEVARDVSLPTKMLALMGWLELQQPPSDPLVSVILATRDRPELLPRAIDSVVAQRFERWQLVIVDDGDTDAVPATLAAYEDERIVTVQGPRRGLGAARNAGLDLATGEVVCYQDDDNVMHPAWLHAVAHVFSQRDDVNVAYGVSIAEHRLPDDLGEYGWWPSFWQLPWSRERLLEENTTDTGSLAHRRDLGEARFDESLPTGEDWDLLLRLTANQEALAVPALSHAYSMAGDDRMSHDEDHQAGLDEIRRRHASRESSSSEGPRLSTGDGAQ